MDHNKIYMNFEDWFDELEGFNSRADRFLDQLLFVEQKDRERFVRHWMKTAWEQGQRSMTWESL